MDARPSAFKSPRSSTQDAFITILNDVEALVASGRIAEAIHMLENLRLRVDGCQDGPPADPNDWIFDCPAQDQIRGFIDLLIANLSA